MKNQQGPSWEREEDDKKSEQKEVQTLTNSYLMTDINKLNGVLPRLYNFADYNAFSKPTDNLDIESGMPSPPLASLPDPILGKRIRLPDGDTTVTALGWAATGEANSGWIRVGVDDYQYLVNASPVTEWLAGAFRINYLTQGSVLFAGANGLVTQNNSAFFWDNASQILTVDEARFFTPNVDNLFIGRGAGNSSHTGDGFMVGIGRNVMLSCTTSANAAGFKLTGVGYEVLKANTTGWNNTGIGYQALLSNTEGSSNCALGFETLRSNTTGIKNTAVGEDCMYFNTTGNYNTAVGTVACYNNTEGEFNTGIGQNALYSNQTGDQNVAVGESALESATTSFNTAVGAYSLTDMSTGAQHTAVGLSALGQITTGNSNVAVGYGAGYNSGTPMTTTGTSVFIGHSANCNANGLSNVIAIGYQAQATASNEFVMGNSSITLVRPTCASSGTGTAALGNATHPWLTLTVGTNPPSAGTVRIGNDSDDGAGSTGVVWKRTAATAREWSGFIGSSGQFVLRDRTGANNAITVTTAGRMGLNGSPTAYLEVTAAAEDNEVFRLQSAATNSDPNYRVFQHVTTTTDATPTDLGLVTLDASKTYLIEARFVARRTGGTAGTAEDGAAYVVRGTYKTVAGTVTLIGAVTTDYTAEDQAAWDATLVIVGSGVRPRGTGAANNNVTWHCTTIVQDLSS